MEKGSHIGTGKVIVKCDSGCGKIQKLCVLCVRRLICVTRISAVNS